MKSVWLGFALCSLLPMSSLMAQQRTAQGVQQSAQQNIDPGGVTAGARQVLELIDGNRAAEVWEGSSNVAKRSIARDAFVQQAMAVRASLGRPVSRTWLSVIRQQVDANPEQQAGNPPQGMYISVRFATTFANGRSAVELVTFRLDEDGVWRVSGYATQ